MAALGTPNSNTFNTSLKNRQQRHIMILITKNRKMSVVSLEVVRKYHWRNLISWVLGMCPYPHGEPNMFS